MQSRKNERANTTFSAEISPSQQKPPALRHAEQEAFVFIYSLNTQKEPSHSPEWEGSYEFNLLP